MFFDRFNRAISSVTMEDSRLLRLCLFFVALGVVTPLLLTWKVWTTERLYPMSPIFEPLAAIDGVASIAIFIFGVSLLLLAQWKKATPYALSLYLLCVVFWISQDLTRNFIWFYMYNFIALTLLSWSVSQIKYPDKNVSDFVHNIRAIICGTYIWGGLNKINYYFYVEVFPYFISPIIPNIWNYELGALFVLAVPFLEVAIGLGSWRLHLECGLGI